MAAEPDKNGHRCGAGPASSTACAAGAAGARSNVGMDYVITRVAQDESTDDSDIARFTVYDYLASCATCAATSTLSPSSSPGP